jgi:hypothetical protein
VGAPLGIDPCARRLDFATRSNDFNLDPRRRHTGT